MFPHAGLSRRVGVPCREEGVLSDPFPGGVGKIAMKLQGVRIDGHQIEPLVMEELLEDRVLLNTMPQ